MVVALVLALVATPAAAREPRTWTRTDVAMEATLAALVVVDWRQTRWHLDHGGSELNPFMGDHPSAARLNATFAAGLVAHALVAHALPHPYRNYWQCVTIGWESATIAWNVRAGIRLRW